MREVPGMGAGGCLDAAAGDGAAELLWLHVGATAAATTAAAAAAEAADAAREGHSGLGGVHVVFAL